MKRYSFLTAGAAAALAGCGHKGQSSGIVPSVAPQAVLRASDNMPAAPIPQAVLTNPFLGEVRRFDGAIAPAGWVIAQGQTLQIAQNRALFSVRGTTGGGDGKTTFKLPNPQHAQFIIAVVGIIPKSPAQLAALRPGHPAPVAGPVILRPGYSPIRKTVVPDGNPLWAPGTFPTREQVETQEAAAKAPATRIEHGSPRRQTR